jgi:DNA topoisomerase-1
MAKKKESEVDGKDLLIVESPAKAKTIEKFLDNKFLVRSSYGHIRDLPKSDKAIDVDNNFKPTYEITEEKEDVVKELKKLMKDAGEVWLATYEDREGEAIAWHLCEALGLNAEKTKRIVFHEITKGAIKNAVASPRTVNKALVDAQQARRILDRLVGF